MGMAASSPSANGGSAASPHSLPATTPPSPDSSIEGGTGSAPSAVAIGAASASVPTSASVPASASASASAALLQAKSVSSVPSWNAFCVCDGQMEL